jgi:hypothetical protein
MLSSGVTFQRLRHAHRKASGACHPYRAIVVLGLPLNRILLICPAITCVVPWETGLRTRFPLLMVPLLLAVFFSVYSLAAQENGVAPVAREDAPPQRQAGDQQRRDDRARKQKQIIFWFSTITAGTISGIALLFFLVFRAQRAKAVRLQDAPLSE